MARIHSKRLAVEATDDQGAVIGLMRHYVVWGEKEEDWPIFIDRAKSVEALLDRVYLQTALKATGLRILGVVVDADEKFAGRWESIQSFCKAAGFKGVPKRSDKAGLILENDDGQKFGAWIMPDNSSHGMLETFCGTLIPDSMDRLWKHAVSSFDKAQELGAPCKKAHYEKAHIHTWLAWQDPSGERMGSALTKNILNPKSPTAKLFVDWFLKLYELELRAS